MKSKFNILILEDDEVQQQELEDTFRQTFNNFYSFFIVSSLDELINSLEKRYYLGISLDAKVPLTKKAIAKKYDIDVINKLNKYHPLGYKSIYTAFPKWNSAKEFGAKINYVSKRDTPVDIWAEEFKKILLDYKKIESDHSIYSEARDILFFPFSTLVSEIIVDVDNLKNYQQLFTFSIEMFYIVMLAILEREELTSCNTLEEKLDFISKNLEELKEKNTPCSKELIKTLEPLAD